MKKKLLYGFFILFLLVQFIPLPRTNPPVTEEIHIPGNLKSVIRNACYDCHSNETRWPWYAYVAPVSFLIVQHVQEGREELNFSTWDQYDLEKKLDILEDIEENIRKDKMPLKQYLWLHRDAQLTPQEKADIIRWAKNYQRLLKKKL